MPKQICSACLGTSPVMINIFEYAPGLDISIAEMITKCTNYKISKGDSYPENICETCLHCAQAAFEIRQTLENSHEAFLRLNKAKDLNLVVGSREMKKLHKCCHCLKAFRWKSNLQRHIRSLHTRERPHNLKTGDQSYTHYPKSFSDKSNLQKHILKPSTNIDEIRLRNFVSEIVIYFVREPV